MAQAGVASFLDLASAFHQMPIAEESKKLTAFSSKYGSFEFNTAPFGLKTTPSVFQRMVDPEEMRMSLLLEAHCGKTGAGRNSGLHVGVGVKQMILAVQREAWWPGITRDVEKLYSECETCARVNIRRKKFAIVSQIIVERPFQRLCLDLVPLPKVEREGRVWEKCLDDFSLFCWLIPIPSPVTAEQVACRFQRRIVEDVVGEPRILWSDADPLFTAERWTKMAECLQAEAKCAFAGHQQANGLVESRVAVIKQASSKIIEEVGNEECWWEVAPYLVAALRNTPTASGWSPNMIVGGWEKTTLPTAVSMLESRQTLAAKVEDMRDMWKMVKDQVNKERKKQVGIRNKKRSGKRFFSGRFRFSQSIARVVQFRYTVERGLQSVAGFVTEVLHYRKCCEEKGGEKGDSGVCR